MRVSNRTLGNIKLGLSYLVILLGVVFVLFPVVWTFSSSLNPGTSLFSSDMSIIPKEVTLKHYRDL
ncbi:MAG TPA: sugar ABC transporter permease, partial [Firmicutes bacterium]|nr:sugar ABC transporter permease [Bacillota bacterium]